MFEVRSLAVLPVASPLRTPGTRVARVPRVHPAEVLAWANPPAGVVTPAASGGRGRAGGGGLPACLTASVPGRPLPTSGPPHGRSSLRTLTACLLLRPVSLLQPLQSWWTPFSHPITSSWRSPIGPCTFRLPRGERGRPTTMFACDTGLPCPVGSRTLSSLQGRCRTLLWAPATVL